MMKNIFVSRLFTALFVLVALGCKNSKTNLGSSLQSQADPRLTEELIGEIKLPEGFQISIFAEIKRARSLAKGDDGVVFVGSRDDKVYAIRDGKTSVILSGLLEPNGVAYKMGALYVAEKHRLIKVSNIDYENHEKNNANIVTIKNYPFQDTHGWKYLAFGPDDHLYVSVGADCDVCAFSKKQAKIDRIKLSRNSSDILTETYAEGVRFSVGFAWHPITKKMWFTDNGRDNLGDEVPADELNQATEKGLNFGFPYCHQGDIKDPEFKHADSCKLGIHRKPELKIQAHSSPLGLKFYTGKMFPQKKYRNSIFVAQHGSWNRSTLVGYKVSNITLNSRGTEVKSIQDFASGWFQRGDRAWGRPVDVLVLNSGALLISDDLRNVVYKVTYKGGGA